MLDKLELVIDATIRLRDAGAPLETVMLSAIRNASTIEHASMFARIVFTVYRDPHVPGEELIAKFREIANER